MNCLSNQTAPVIQRNKKIFLKMKMNQILAEQHQENRQFDFSLAIISIDAAHSNQYEI